MLDFLILIGIVMILLENSPTRRQAAGTLWNKAKRATRGLFG